jgi:hypothetical protein
VEPLDWGSGARELGVRAISAARPSHPRARLRREPVSAMRCEAKGGKVRRKKGERDRCVGPTRQ